MQFYVVILSEAKNLSFFSLPETSERFFASLRMTNNFGTFPERINPLIDAR